MTDCGGVCNGDGGGGGEGGSGLMCFIWNTYYSEILMGRGPVSVYTQGQNTY